MKLSTKGRYGLRMLVDLAVQQDDVITLQSTAERQDVSVNYLEQIAKELKKAGFVDSVKGPNGGYMLKKKPENIIVGNVLRTLEGDLLMVEPDDEQDSPLKKTIHKKIYDPLNKTIAQYFDSITLSDILSSKKL